MDSLASDIIMCEETHPLNLTDFCGRPPLRIGILMDHPSPHMNALLEAVAARNDCTLEVVYCAPCAPGRNWGSHAGRVPHEIMRGFSGPLGIRFNPFLFRTMMRKRVDAWIVNTVYGSPTTLLAACWLRFRGKPWVYMNEPVRPRSGILASLRELPLGFLLNRADGVIGTGKAAVDFYRVRLGNDRSYESVPYYIDLNAFINLPDPASPAAGDDLAFVTSCQFIQRKGITYLLQACKKLPQTGWNLTLIGDGPLRSEFEKELNTPALQGKVKIHGTIPYANREIGFAGKHVFVLSSLWDGWGMVIPEALASGLPAISTDAVISGHEFIRSGENGFLVPTENPDALAEKMQWFLSNPSSYSSMSRAARQSVRFYRADIGADKLVSYLRNLEEITGPKPAVDSKTIDSLTATWQLLATPQRRFEKAKLGARSLAKRAIIRGSLAVRRPHKAKGNLLVAYHLVLKEDRRNFDEQLKFFKDHFRICSPGELLQTTASGDSGDFRLAITFDDGFRLLMHDCFEVLEKHGIKAGFYVPAAFIGSTFRTRSSEEFSRRSHYYNYPLEPMSPEDLKALAASGHEIGSHGLFHTNVCALVPERAKREFIASRRMIADWTGIEPKGFAYPYGGISNSVGNPAALLMKAGFSYGLTLSRGIVQASSNPFLIPRHHLEGNWPICNLRYFLLN
jgi:glycosyltransferase involved in cell wall biosynthesis/peptidoglycan/xylan/chitin deacetylase (PgdA/CDA1 family)